MSVMIGFSCRLLILKIESIYKLRKIFNIMSCNKKVVIHTFGCQMNKLDSELVEESLIDNGYQLVDNENEADIILFNTCSVREHAEERVLQRVRQLSKDKIIGIMGCFAQRLGEKLFKMLPKHLNIVCGTRVFANIAYMVDQAILGEKVCDTNEDAIRTAGVLAAHNRYLHKGYAGYVSVMRGCNNFCSYCIVPYVRGREVSRPADAVVEECKRLADMGATEITLLGQNVDAYGKDNGSSLAELLRLVHDKIPDVLRWRFVTSHPRDVDVPLVQAMEELPRVCKHLHMPAQSGSTKILQAMKRGYTREIYDQKLEIVNKYAPGTLITSDFIVGFPTESDEDFEATRDLFVKAEFQTSYIFKYSPRPGTFSADNMVDDVPMDVKKERNQILLGLQEQVSKIRTASYVGKEVEVLVEGPTARSKNRYSGRTDTNMICIFDAPENGAKDLIGKLAKLRVVGSTPLTLQTEIL